MGMIPWYLLALGSAVFSTAFTIIRKLALQKEHALKFESARSIAVVMILLAMLPFIPITAGWEVLLFVYLLSILSVVCIVLVAKCFRHNQISLIYPLLNLKPVIVLILANVFLSEAVSARNISGIFVMFLAAYVLEADHKFSDLFIPLKLLFKSKYNLYLLAALFLISIGALLDKYIINNYLEPVEYLLLIWVFTAINMNIYHGVRYGFDEVRGLLYKKLSITFAAAFFSIGAGLLFLYAVKYAPVSLVIPVTMLSTAFVVVFGGKFFNEENLIYRFIISALMIIGVYLIIT